MMRSLGAAAAAAVASAASSRPSSVSLLRPFSSTHLRSLEQAIREGTATDKPLRSPDAPDDPAKLAADAQAGDDSADAEAARKERDARIAVAGGGFGPAIIAQNLAEREAQEEEEAVARAEKNDESGESKRQLPHGHHHPRHHHPDPRHRVDPTKTPPGIDVPSAPLPRIFSEQLPHAARKLKKRFSEAIEYVKMGEMGGAAAGELRRPRPSSATRHGAAVEVTGDAAAIEAETKTQGMPPLGEADDLHRRLADEMRREEGM